MKKGLWPVRGNSLLTGRMERLLQATILVPLWLQVTHKGLQAGGGGGGGGGVFLACVSIHVALPVNIYMFAPIPCLISQRDGRIVQIYHPQMGSLTTHSNNESKGGAKRGRNVHQLNQGHARAKEKNTGKWSHSLFMLVNIETGVFAARWGPERERRDPRIDEDEMGWDEMWLDR